MSQQSYTPDEFDNPPAGPVGVHRGPRSVGARMAPYLVVLVVAALCGLVVWGVTAGFFGMDSTTPVASQTTSATATAPASTSESASPSTSATPSATASESSASPTASATSTVNKSSEILVVNGVGKSGYAAQNVTKLKKAGYDNATPGNPKNKASLPDSSTVWYQNEADKATAEDVAKTLGIDNVVQLKSASSPIVAVLMK
ncbi:LytR C-terminal domain-containing protein [Bifidobacterium vespertilionis]|uniref:LytR C-terminal domain-containing protein n=1 Tax=Bifidobacterium vespertilionis TaxID=2562524 RepID=UPI001BDCC327|nr:LytR C-terminal domain-containing protein [Bifidobacterium vespertilionis]MBT1178641.1 LytR C-terminal domain-containing protein [Bifidobacterium vespertilionis]